MFVLHYVQLKNDVFPILLPSLLNIVTSLVNFLTVFYERAKLTGALYKHRVIFTVDGHITNVSGHILL